MGAVPDQYEELITAKELRDEYFCGNRYGGMYSGVLRMRGTPKEIISARHEMAEDMRKWLNSHRVNTIYAYNAAFDKKHLPELCDYRWHDIMKIAAYRQFNDRIPVTALCCKTGRLKSDYGVESIYRLLSGNHRYTEKHNGWYDAVDELLPLFHSSFPPQFFAFRFFL